MENQAHQEDRTHISLPFDVRPAFPITFAQDESPASYQPDSVCDPAGAQRSVTGQMNEAGDEDAFGTCYTDQTCGYHCRESAWEAEWGDDDEDNVPPTLTPKKTIPMGERMEVPDPISFFDGGSTTTIPVIRPSAATSSSPPTSTGLQNSTLALSLVQKIFEQQVQTAVVHTLCGPRPAGAGGFFSATSYRLSSLSCMHRLS